MWDLAFLDQWIRQHAADAKALGKPLLVEEFGKQVAAHPQPSVAAQSPGMLVQVGAQPSPAIIATVLGAGAREDAS